MESVARDQHETDLEQIVAEWKTSFATFLNIPPHSLDSFLLGTLRPQGCPGLLLKFLEHHTGQRMNSPILSFAEYKDLFKKQGQGPKPPNRADIVARAEKRYFPLEDDRELWIDWCFKHELKEHSEALNEYRTQQDRQLAFSRSHDMTAEGYIAFLKGMHPMLRSFMETPMPVFIAEAERKRHTYITGGTGSGKSESLKHLVHAYISGDAPPSTVVIIDPHGDLALEIARFKENFDSGKLVYFDPFLSGNALPTMNPFDLKDRSPKAVNTAALTLANAFEEILKGTGFTNQMSALLIPCLTTLLYMGGKTLADLQFFMKEDLNAHLVQAGLASPIASHRQFFEYAFFEDGYAPSKHGIYTKLQTLLNSQVFYDCIVGPNTIDLEAAIEDRKLIIFNLSKGRLGTEASQSIGRFIIARLQAIALSRADKPPHERTPIHLFIDECQNYISEFVSEILTESRKYGLHMTLAQQILGQGMDSQLQAIVLSNTGMKMTGANALKTHKAISQETDTPLEELQNLSIGCFHTKSGVKSSLPVQIPSRLVGLKNTMSAAQWEMVCESQLAQYYRSIKPFTQPNSAPTQTTGQTPANDTRPAPPINAEQNMQPKFEVDI